MNVPLQAPPPPASVYDDPRSGWPEELASWRPGALRGGTWTRPSGLADSVQWVDLPACPALDLSAVERAYFAWVPRLSAGGVRARWSEHAPGPLTLCAQPLDWPPMIRMDVPRQSSTQRARPILGGALAHAGGSLAFELLDRSEGRRLVVAVRGLRPRLPLSVYLALQAPVHERSTNAFLRQARYLVGQPSVRNFEFTSQPLWK
jgi:hypothetical protein